MAHGFVASGSPASSVTIIEPNADKCAQYKAESFSVFTSLSDVPSTYAPHVTVLAIKPQAVAESAAAIGNFYAARPAHMVISILAGTPIARLAQILGNKAPIIRAMPNTPALIGEGITACVASNTVSFDARIMATDLLAGIGEVVWLEHESQIDIATAISGSGPAYMFHVLECLVESAVAHGLDANVARALSIHTMRGSALLASESSDALSVLRQNVTSKGGTTEAALNVLMPVLPNVFRTAIDAAITRAKALAEVK